MFVLAKYEREKQLETRSLNRRKFGVPPFEPEQSNTTQRQTTMDFKPSVSAFFGHVSLIVGLILTKLWHNKF